jgi:hypothetical protein
MSENKALLLTGYSFELTEYICADGITTITVRASGNGEHPSDISSWAIEICPGDAQKFLDEVCIVACEKRRRAGAWQSAAAMKTTDELTGDIPFSGVVIDEWVGRYAEDPPTEFRITLDAELPPEPIRVAFIAGGAVYKSTECLVPRQSTDSPQLWNTPIEKMFCLYLVVPDGYKPHGPCRANVSISRRGIFLAYEPEGEEPGEQVRTMVQGTVKILASVPLKSYQACGDTVEASTCDCFDICETVAVTGPDEKIELRDIAVCPKKNSFDMTLLSAHCGKSVYRLDGMYLIDCKRRR